MSKRPGHAPSTSITRLVRCVAIRAGGICGGAAATRRAAVHTVTRVIALGAPIANMRGGAAAVLLGGTWLQLLGAGSAGDCSSQNYCNGHGACIAATSQCRCYDGERLHALQCGASEHAAAHHRGGNFRRRAGWGSDGDVASYKAPDCSLRECAVGSKQWRCARAWRNRTEERVPGAVAQWLSLTSLRSARSCAPQECAPRGPLGWTSRRGPTLRTRWRSAPTWGCATASQVWCDSLAKRGNARRAPGSFHDDAAAPLPGSAGRCRCFAGFEGDACQRCACARCATGLRGRLQPPLTPPPSQFRWCSRVPR